jgi:beta-lactamase regulating signal transducer with metallopeptidase domain
MDVVLNWLWQGGVVALALRAMLRVLDRARANVRYVVCWAGLLLVVALPVLPALGSRGLAPEAIAFVPADAVVSVPDSWWASGVVMAAAWTVWAAVHVVRFLLAMVALRRARASSQAFPWRLESGLSHWRQVRHEGRRPALALSESVTTAAVLGCGSPLIAVAPSLVTTLDADELDRVLIHEWAHVQRRDDLVNVLQFVVRIVAGWHPAVWWIDRRLRVEREIACDEMTVAVTGSPKSYAACLLKLAELRGATQNALAAPAMLAASGLRARVTRIVSRHPFVAPGWSRGLAAAVVSTLSVVSIGLGEVRLVETSVFALPFDSIQRVGAPVTSVAPVAPPADSARLESAPAPWQGLASDRVRRPSTDLDVVPVSLATQVAEPQGQPAPAPTPAGEPRGAAEAPSDSVVEPQPAGGAAAASAAAPTQSTVAGDRARTPWAQAAEGGTVLGQKSKEAGLATAGVFTRFARRVARSF